MNRVIVLYGMPKDPVAFDRHYRDIHIPLCLKMPHLAGFEVNIGNVSASDQGVHYHCAAILSFANAAEREASLASPEGMAAVKDVENFATGGVLILTLESESQM
ncbi:uncharacterized protein (TIGR02118 family) [Rhodoligotrophos appendicifer]|uniref:EthD family reductase n=1 Tax=Rhodoligotrophos appendicifer TaxID=987056 RepID=UPI001185ECC3|nr:EthD family reductase [Rhodoligotrophos appendicifer]